MFSAIRIYCLFLGVLGSFACSIQAKEASPTRVAANNAVELQKAVGKSIIVHGKVSRASVSKSGHHFLNFYSSKLTVVCFKSDLGGFPAGGPAKLWKEKEIDVSGKLELFKGKPQIKLTKASQVKLTAAAGSSKSQNKFSLRDVKVDGSSSDKSSPKFELKQTGKLSWMSPAGLMYRGKDAAGLTRVEHVLRHAADQPQRRGSHGVFDGGDDSALALVDEAWELVKTRKIKPKKEGDRLAYTVPMGRRVGYLGGRNGANRNHPPLKNVFIVIRGKSEVITAFPR